ncbi:MAG: hypothetical protein U0L88_09575 [Acutalibacteraceae bacterium]|nr:hypothetical protein [Acutalibacteraceae bacterium]
MIKQVCRFCRWLITNPCIYCTKRNREYTEQYAKSTNNCGDFELNVVDAFFENERGYQPREPKPEVDDRQITFEELEI